MSITDFKYAKCVADGWLAELFNTAGYASVHCLQQGWGVLQFGRAMDDLPLRLCGRVYKNGLGAHTPSEILIRSSSPIKRFEALVGPSDNEGSRKAQNRMIFSVANGRGTLWQSRPLLASDRPVQVDVPLHGATEFKISAMEVTGALAFSHANWVNPQLVCANGDRIQLGSNDRKLLAATPFSFRYGGKDSTALLPEWKRRAASKKLSREITEHTLTYRDPRTGLECVLKMKSFRDFPAVEWVVRFKNTGRTDTPLLEDIQAMNVSWAAAGLPVLRYSTGSRAELDDFMPHEAPLNLLSTVRLASEGGRSSSGTLPFFNVMGDGEGFISAIGWSGQWAAEFSYDKSSALTARAGMQKTRLKLHPGEEIRSPSMLLLYWKGEALSGHNMLRQFLLKYHTHRPDGKTIPTPVSNPSWGGMKADVHLERIRTTKKQGLKYDYYWIDAGWFGDGDRYLPAEAESDWGRQVGKWQVNPMIYPHGMRPIADAAKKAGMKFLLWLEPERAICGSPLTIEHPDWFLGEKKPGNNLLFNLGIPAARKWLIDFTSGLIEKHGIDCFRQDFNMPPLEYWRSADAADRQGMHEIRHIEGLYEFWDELLRRHKGLLIDNCASGGRRLDLETTGRSIPLWRTDFPGGPSYIPIGPQAHTYGLAYWIPCNATGFYAPGDTYRLRSSMSSGISFPIGGAPEKSEDTSFPWNWYRKMLAEVRRATPCFLGDFYPLTPHSISPSEWLAYQMHRPDLDEGFVLAFRREKADFDSAQFRLRGLSANATYVVEDADRGKVQKLRGEILAADGIQVKARRPESRLIFYRRKK